VSRNLLRPLEKRIALLSEHFIVDTYFCHVKEKVVQVGENWIT
jgi:hypothetical protein